MTNNYNVVVFEIENSYRHQNYSKHFVISDGNYEIGSGEEGEEVIEVTRGDIVPFRFAIDYGIEIKNSLDFTIHNSDTKFSNSNGFYDSEFHTVFEGDLVSRNDLVTLDSGDIVHSDDAFCCGECGSVVRDERPALRQNGHDRQWRGN